MGSQARTLGPVSRFRHPVAGVDLLQSPEMQLRHPVERQETASESYYGWQPLGPVPSSGVASLTFQRDPDERLGILVQGHGEWWKDPERLVKWDSGINSLRVHVAVDGLFADGRPGRRVG